MSKSIDEITAQLAADIPNIKSRHAGYVNRQNQLDNLCRAKDRMEQCRLTPPDLDQIQQSGYKESAQMNVYYRCKSENYEARRTRQQARDAQAHEAKAKRQKKRSEIDAKAKELEQSFNAAIAQMKERGLVQ